MLDFTPALSPTVSPLIARCGGTVRSTLDKLAQWGYHSVHLSAAQRGIRPRELDRSARRDLLTTLGRHGMMLGGLDLLIPLEDFTDSSKLDRAATATLAAIDLAADLGRVPLCLNLPVSEVAHDVRGELVAAAERRGVPLAIHAEHETDALLSWLQEIDQRCVGAAIDPATQLALRHDPCDVAVRLSEHLLVARLDDGGTPSVASPGGRCSVGQGRLDLLAYRAALAAAQRLRTIVVELRELTDPVESLHAATKAWGGM